MLLAPLLYADVDKCAELAIGGYVLVNHQGITRAVYKGNSAERDEFHASPYRLCAPCVTKSSIHSLIYPKCIAPYAPSCPTSRTPPHFHLLQLLATCGISSHLIASRRNAQPIIAPLFGDTLVRIEAVRKLLAVLVARMIDQHLLARCALERLEASFALDVLGRGVLIPHSQQHIPNFISNR